MLDMGLQGGDGRLANGGRRWFWDRKGRQQGTTRPVPQTRLDSDHAVTCQAIISSGDLGSNASRTDRGDQRSDGDGGGAGSGVPTDHAANLHCAPDPQQPGLRQLEGPQAAGQGVAPDLCGGQCRGGGSGVGCVRRWRLGAQVPHGGCRLAARGDGFAVLASGGSLRDGRR